MLQHFGFSGFSTNIINVAQFIGHETDRDISFG